MFDYQTKGEPGRPGQVVATGTLRRGDLSGRLEKAMASQSLPSLGVHVMSFRVVIRLEVQDFAVIINALAKTILKPFIQAGH